MEKKPIGKLKKEAAVLVCCADGCQVLEAMQRRRHQELFRMPVL